MAILPINERFTMNSESKILSQWTKRQASWKDFKVRMASELDRPQDELVMSRADNYRIKSEEYETIQVKQTRCIWKNRMINICSLMLSSVREKDVTSLKKS